MIKTEIYIENRKLDITEDISALLTYALDDVKDFASRNTNFSKTLVLPGTANNNFLLGHIFDVRVSNFYNQEGENVGYNYNPAKTASCIIFQDHIQIFKGVFRVLEMNITGGVPEYECAVFGELGGMISAFGVGKLEDLDFSAYDHTWNTTNIQASWNTINGSSYYYPLIDYGGVSINKIDYDIRAFRPAFYVKEYIDKIFEAIGYTYSSTLMDSVRFKSLVIPNNTKDFKRISYNLINASRTSTADVINAASPSEVAITMSSSVVYLFTVGGSSLFTYTGTDSIVTSVQISMYGSFVGLGSGYKLALYKNGVEVTDFTKIIIQTSDSFTHFYNWTETHDIPMATGDTLELKATETGTAVGTDNLKVIAGTFKTDSYSSILVDILPGNTVPVNQTLPRNVLQKDFFSSVLKLFNIYVYEDNTKTKHVNMTPYVDFYDLNVSGVVDWSYKLDRGKNIKLKPLSELNSRYYNFKFKKDSDYYNDLYFSRYGHLYGDYVYDSQYEFANEKNDLELIFSPSVLVGYAGTDKVVSALYKKNAGVEERTDTNIRILQAKKITSVAAWDIEDSGVDLAANLTDYGYAGHYDDPDAPANDIHWGVPAELFFTLVSGAVNVTQFNVYYSPYMAEITDKDSKLMTASFKLTAADIFKLDFSKLIYIDGAYWRLNKVEDYNATTPDLCKCELLNVINLSY